MRNDDGEDPKEPNFSGADIEGSDGVDLKGDYEDIALDDGGSGKLDMRVWGDSNDEEPDGETDDSPEEGDESEEEWDPETHCVYEFDDGSNCRGYAGEDGLYCPYHHPEYGNDSGWHPLRHCHGETDDGEKCMRVVEGEYCHDHMPELDIDPESELGSYSDVDLDEWRDEFDGIDDAIAVSRELTRCVIYAEEHDSQLSLSELMRSGDDERVANLAQIYRVLYDEELSDLRNRWTDSNYDEPVVHWLRVDESEDKEDRRRHVARALEAETDWMAVIDRSSDRHTSLWRWTENGWEEGASEYVRRRMATELGGDYSDADIDRVCEMLGSLDPVSEDELNMRDREGHYIPFANGVLDMSDVVVRSDGTVDISGVELLEHQPEHRFTYRLNVQWDPVNANTDRAKEFLKTTLPTSPDSRRTLLRMSGLCLIPEDPVDAFLVCVGDGENGKSIYLDEILRRVLGPENTSSKTLGQLENDKFATAEVVNKLANISSELDQRKLESVSKMKALSSASDMVTCERKYRDAWQSNNDATLIFAANSPPRIMERSDGIKRRLYPVYWPVNFVDDPKENDPLEQQKRKKSELVDELTQDDVLSGWVLMWVSELAQVLESEEISERDADERMEAYERHADAVADFASVCLTRAPDGPDEYPNGVMAVEDIEKCYDRYAEKRGHPRKMRSSLIKGLQSLHSTTLRRRDVSSWTKGNDQIGIYVGMGFSKMGMKYLPEDAFTEKYRDVDDEDVDLEESRRQTELDDNSGVSSESEREPLRIDYNGEDVRINLDTLDDRVVGQINDWYDRYRCPCPLGVIEETVGAVLDLEGEAVKIETQTCETRLVESGRIGIADDGGYVPGDRDG